MPDDSPTHMADAAGPDRAGGCPDEGVLWRATIGGAPDPRTAHHLDGCASCRALAEQIRASEHVVDRARTWAGEAAVEPKTGSDFVAGFHIIREIHRGAQGVVYEAEQNRTRRRVAVKMLLGGIHATAQQRARFAREVDAISGLHHPGIVTLYASFVLPDGRCGYSMELVAGQRLDEWWSRLESTREDRRRLVRLFVRLCDAVQHAHLSGVIHRDLKPSNVLVIPGEPGTEAPKVLDFGIARAIGQEVGGGAAVTMTGEFAGTPAYAAPEQVRAGASHADVRTDVHAIGVMLYEAICGRLPYGTEGSAWELASRIAGGEPAAPRQIDPTVDRDVETIIRRAMEKDPARRYQSAAALGDDLTRHLEGRPIEARRDSLVYVVRKLAARRKGLAAVIAAAAIAGPVFVAYLVSTNRTLQDQREKLRTALDESLLERARSLAATGDVRGAEAILWDRAERMGLPDPGNQDAMFTDTPEKLATAWSLWEMYRRAPCQWSRKVGQGMISLGVLSTSDEPGRFYAFENSGALVTVSELDGSVSGPTLPRGPAVPGGRYFQVTGVKGGRLVVLRTEGASIVEVATGRRVASLVLPEPSGIVNAGLNRDGRYLAILDSHGALEVYDVEHPGIPRTIATDARFRRPMTTLAMPLTWDPTGSVLAYSNAVATERFIRLDDGAEIGRISTRSGGEVMSLAYSPDGDQVVLGLEGGNGEVWTLEGPTFVADLQVPMSAFSKFAISEDGGIVAAVPELGRSIRVFDGRAGTEIQTLHGHAGHITSTILSNDGASLFSVDDEGVVKRWSLDPRPGAETIVAARGITVHDAWEDASAGGFRIAGGAGLTGLCRRGADGRWSIPPTAAGLANTDSVWTEIAVLPGKSRYVLAGLTPGMLRVLGADGVEVVQDIPVNLEKVGAAIGHPTQGLVAACGVGGVVLADLDSDRVESLGLDARSHYSSLAFSPDGTRLAAVGISPEVLLWDVATRARLPVLATCPRKLRSTAFSPDGRVLYAGGDTRTLYGWDIATQRVVLRAETPSDIFAIAIHPLGCVAAVGERSGEISLHDLRTGSRLAVVAEAGSSIFRCRFTRGGRGLVYTAYDGSVVHVDLTWAVQCISGNRPLDDRSPSMALPETPIPRPEAVRGAE